MSDEKIKKLRLRAEIGLMDFFTSVDGVLRPEGRSC